MAFPVLGQPHPTYTDPNGDPYSSGTLTFTEPSDGSDKSTYPTAADADAASNANPAIMTLNQRGSTDNSTGIWGVDGEEYDVTLKDVDGNTIWTAEDVAWDITNMDSTGVHIARTAAEQTALIGVYDPDTLTMGDIVQPWIEPGHVERYGVNTNPGTTDMSLALQTALNSGYEVLLPPDTVSFASTLTVSDYTRIRGVAVTNTQLNYTGAGTAFASATPSARTYSWMFSDFALTDTGTGLIGFDMQNVNTSSFMNMRVAGFATNVKITGDTAGWAVYNRFYNVYSGTATTYNWHIGAKGSNATTLIACRSNGGSITPIGMYIADSNEVHITNCQIEGQTGTGIQIRDTAAYASAGQVIVSECRFENNTTYSVDIGAGFSGAMLLHNIYYSTGGAILDNGTATQIRGRQNVTSNAGEKTYNTMDGTSFPANRFTRTGNSASGQKPAFLIEDTNTGSGNPITCEIETPRGTVASGSRAMHTTKSGIETFGIAPSGEICTNQYSATGAATGAVGTIPVYDSTTGLIIGYIQIYSGP